MSWNLSFDEYSAQSTGVCWGGVPAKVHAQTSLPPSPVVLSGRYIIFSFEVNRFDAEITVVVSYLKIAFHIGIVLIANTKYLLSNFVFEM